MRFRFQIPTVRTEFEFRPLLERGAHPAPGERAESTARVIGASAEGGLSENRFGAYFRPTQGRVYTARVTILSPNKRFVTQRIRLGPRELQLLFTLEQKGKSAFNFEDAENILDGSRSSVWNVISRLKTKNRIQEIERGRYLLVPARAGYEGSWAEVPLLLVPHLIDKYYIGFWTALNYWGMTEQSPHVVFIATTKRKRSLKFGPTEFEFVTLSPKKFFGFVEEQIEGGRFYVSSREKTIVDCFMHPKYSGGLDEAVKGLSRAGGEVDYDALVKAAKQVGVNAVLRRLGYVLQILGLGARATSRIRSLEFRGYRWLDPTGPKKPLGYSRDFGLILNRSPDELRAWTAGQ